MRALALYVVRLLAFVAALATVNAFATEYGTLKYADGRTFQTGVFEARYIGQLPTKSKSPYLVFSGRGCMECDAGRSIYIHSPDDGPMLGGERDPRYSYPGEYRDLESEQVAHVVRVFLGQCVPSLGSVVLWFQRARDDSGKWTHGVHVAEVVDDRLVSRSWTKDPPKVSAVLAAVKKGTCRELKGIKGYLEP